MHMAVIFFVVALLRIVTAVPYYPLYAIDSGHTDLTETDYQVISTNFSFIQGSYTSEQLQKFKKANPEFHPVWYINSMTTDARDVENAGRLNAAFYVTGTLAEGVQPSETTLSILPVPGCSHLKQSTTSGNFTSKDGYVTFVRVGSEIVKILDATRNGTYLTVTRGFAETTPRPYDKGERVFVPVYNSEGFPGGKGPVKYTLDPQQELAVNRLINHTLTAVERGYAGSWFDLFSDHQFNGVDIGGKKLKATWDFKTNAYYDRDGILGANKQRLSAVWAAVRKKLGYYPVILANNMAGGYFPQNGNCKELLETTSSFKPLDGYCLEQFCGVERNSDPYESGCDPSQLEFLWEPAALWLKHLQIVMDAAQNNLAAFPMVAQAGCKSVKLEMIGTLRDKFETYAYASYLLAVESPSGPTRLGIPAFYQRNGTRYAYVHPPYTWQIGRPRATAKPSNVTDYQPHGHMSFVRHFTGGLVVVNPYNKTDTLLQLNYSYLNPVEMTIVSTITPEAQTGYILLLVPGY